MQDPISILGIDPNSWFLRPFPSSHNIRPSCVSLGLNISADCKMLSVDSIGEHSLISTVLLIYFENE